MSSSPLGCDFVTSLLMSKSAQQSFNRKAETHPLFNLPNLIEKTVIWSILTKLTETRALSPF